MNSTEKENLLNKFLAKWSIDDIKAMTIDQYVVGENNQTFCYWVETETLKLGNIKGQNSFIFGIYKRKEKLKQHTGNYKTDGEYSWLAKFGENKSEAFGNVKSEIIKIIEYAETGNFSLIEDVPLHPFFKWKVAFLYSNKRLIPIYEKRVLHKIAESFGLTISNELKISEIQEIMMQNKLSHQEYYEYTRHLWENFSKDTDGGNEENNLVDEIPKKIKNRKASEITILDLQVRSVKSRTYFVEQKHKRLQLALKEKLTKQFGENYEILFEENNVDVKLIQPNQIIFYEVKSDSFASDCIRKAIGQLLQYSFFDETNKKKKLVVIGQYAPNSNEIEFIEFVKKSLNVEFDYENIELS